MSDIIDVTHIIAVKDLDAAVAYYRDVLEFEVEDRGAEGWRWFVRGPASIMAGHCPDEVPAVETNNHSSFLRLTMTDVDAYHDVLKINGAEFSNAIESKPWGFRSLQ
jgi:uncharacterized glyoxalase superfamily protein PhnB